MTITTTTSHVEAYCSTGVSPGRARARLELDHGPILEADVGYELHGPDRDPVVVLGGISADRHLAPTPERPRPGWWPGVVARDGGLDPSRRRLVGIDWVGGPACPTPLGPSVPVTTKDQARALAAVLDHLALERVAVVGASYGGMVALAFAALFPRRVSRLVVLCAAHRTHPMASAWRAIQRRVVRLAEDAGHAEAGVALGRALAMTTYRSAREFDARFDWRPAGSGPGTRFPVEAYLDARGAAFAERFDARAFATLSESVDRHEVDPAGVVVPTTLVTFDTDALVPPWLGDELTATAPGVRRHVTLPSIFGHDAFLKETDAVSAAIGSALAGREDVR